ncbi:tetratricopeptide repeat protein [Marinobacter changyiensis]|uniref:tetratricopeptide repeat protein n=1 Tax=Marinobacter changyiensis TaxID=2604091 RepID=UPI0012646FF9|nr:tetratricopeptide repeat protein [Marinobacter changyiensis]
MKSLPLVRTILLIITLGLGLMGCRESANDMSQEEIQYLSHLDQARFFQRQGELKASTLEARSAIDLQPSNAEPHFVIIDNLLTAGDAVNAERQANLLAEYISEDVMDGITRNRINLILAKSWHLRGEPERALGNLDEITDPDRAQELEAALLRGDILLGNGQIDEAEAAYEAAKDLDPSAVEPLIGLSRVAYAKDQMTEAEALIEEAIAIDETDPELWLWRAQLAQARENWPQAEEAYIQALEDIGQYDIMTYQKYETIASLIRVLRAQNKSAEAFVYQEILAKSAPGTIRGNLVAARDAFNEGDLEQAGRYLEEILSQSPNHEQTALMLGMIRFRQGRMEEAERLLAPVARNEDAEDAAKLLAATKIQMRDIDEARAILEGLNEKDTDPGILALVGIATLAGGESQAGEEFIEKSLELNPDNNALRLRYARYLLQQNKPEQVIAQAEEVMKRDPESSDARLLMIQAHIAAGSVDTAVESANAWVKEQPDSIAAKLTRGQLAVRQGDIGEAKRYFEQAAAATTENPTPLIALANLANDQGNTEEAGKHLRAAVTMAPDNRQALQALAGTLTVEESKSFLTQLLEEKPDATGPRLVLLEYALLEGNDQATDEHTAILLEPTEANTPARLTPFVAGIYNGVAAKKIQTQELDQAKAILDRARALFPENEDINLQAATVAFQTDRKSEALDILQETKLVHPDSARPFLLEAAQMSRERKHKEAAELYQLALQKQRTADTEVRYAQALQRSDQPAKAIEALEGAKTAFPGEDRITFILALAYQEAKKFDEAIANYEELLETQPENVIILNNLAWLYQQSEDPRALEIAERAFQLSPESAAVADTYGWILFTTGRQADSLPILEKAHELEPESEDIALHLAEAYKAAGEQGKAKAILEKI